MTVAEELYRMGIPREKCESLAKTLIDTAASSGRFDHALSGMLTGVRILIQKEQPIPRESLSLFGVDSREK